jgi:membrane protease YdiL (CAAX protease family)
VRLAAWIGLVGVVAALNFTARVEDLKPSKNVFYEYSNAIGGVIQYAVLLGLALLIAIDLPYRRVFALRRPRSWRRAGAIALAILAAVYAIGALVSVLGDPGKEQGLAPTYWNGHRAAAFAANLALVAIVAPVAEEMIFRGVGFSLLERFGDRAAIAGVGVAFGLWHGLVIALPLLIAFGAGLAFMRSRTGSIFPGMILHGAFNTLAVVFGVLRHHG